jgi:hypothetical protein
MLDEEIYANRPKIVIRLKMPKSLLMARASDNQADVSNLLNISEVYRGRFEDARHLRLFGRHL